MRGRARDVGASVSGTTGSASPVRIEPFCSKPTLRSPVAADVDHIGNPLAMREGVRRLHDAGDDLRSSSPDVQPGDVEPLRE